SLLRHPRAVSTLEDLAASEFRLVIDDPRVSGQPDRVRRVALCSGKVCYDLVAAAEEDAVDDVAVVRVEQLYPFPQEALAEVLERYSQASELVWVQEEPANMGAWTYMRPRLASLAGDRFGVAYVGRPERASP